MDASADKSFVLQKNVLYENQSSRHGSGVPIIGVCLIIVSHTHQTDHGNNCDGETTLYHLTTESAVRL